MYDLHNSSGWQSPAPEENLKSDKRKDDNCTGFVFQRRKEGKTFPTRPPTSFLLLSLLLPSYLTLSSSNSAAERDQFQGYISGGTALACNILQYIYYNILHHEYFFPPSHSIATHLEERRGTLLLAWLNYFPTHVNSRA